MFIQDFIVASFKHQPESMSTSKVFKYSRFDCSLASAVVGDSFDVLFPSRTSNDPISSSLSSLNLSEVRLSF